ncbi:MAG: substrate binding domain-containing protein [Burkholderiaceae bacterium]
MIAALMEAYPQVCVDLMLDDRVVDLVVEGDDVGVRTGPLVDTSVMARRLQSSRMHAVASPRYLASHGTPEQPSDLSQDNCLGSLATGPDSQWCFTRDGTSVTIPVRGRFCTNDGHALLNAAVAGVGIIVHVDILVAPQVTAGS